MLNLNGTPTAAPEYVSAADVASGPSLASVFLCPLCDQVLAAIASPNRTDPDQASDVYRCPTGCGTFEFVRADRRLRCLRDHHVC